MQESFCKTVISAILFLGGSVGCQDRAAETATPTREAREIITQAAPLSARAYEQRASEAARRWRPDASLLGAHIIIPAKRPDGTFTREAGVLFDFVSKADENHWYTMDFDSWGTFKDFEFSSRPTKGEVVPIESSDWPLDSTDAWRIGQAAGGKAMLQKHEEETVDMRCSVTLERWNPSYTGRVVWSGLCFDTMTFRSFGFRIDAKTGEVVEKTAE